MMGAGKQESVEDFHSQPPFYGATAGPLIEQVRKWQRGRGQKFSQAALAAAEQTVERAILALDLDLKVNPTQLTGALLDRCSQRGFVVSFKPDPHPVLGRKMRADIDIKSRVIHIYQPALTDLAERVPPGSGELVLPLVLAHELFHALAPQCKEPELSAHLFAARVCGFPIFPGTLDME